MKTKKNVIGEVYNRLTVIGDAPYRTNDRRVFVQCTCGEVKDVLLNDIRRAKVTSCGCYNKERMTTHGDSRTRLYGIYKGMLNRCYLTTHSRYEAYGGRGITVCDTWLHNYPAFKEWAISAGYNDTLSIDRKNVDGNYDPSNCQWIPMSMQQRNKQIKKGGTSMYIGVSWYKHANKWAATIKVNGIQKNLGLYVDELSAAKIRDQYIKDNRLENYKLNF